MEEHHKKDVLADYTAFPCRGKVTRLDKAHLCEKEVKLQVTVKRTKTGHEVKPPTIVHEPSLIQAWIDSYTKITQPSPQGWKGLQWKGSAEGHYSWVYWTQQTLQPQWLRNWLCGVDSSTDLWHNIGQNLMKGHNVAVMDQGNSSHLPGSGASFGASAGPETHSSNPCMHCKPWLQWTKCVPAGLAGQWYWKSLTSLNRWANPATLLPEPLKADEEHNCIETVQMEEEQWQPADTAPQSQCWITDKKQAKRHDDSTWRAYVWKHQLNKQNWKPSLKHAA